MTKYAVFVGKRLYGYADSKFTRDEVMKALRKASWTKGKRIFSRKIRKVG